MKKKKIISLILIFTMVMPMIFFAIPNMVLALENSGNSTNAPKNIVDGYVDEGLQALYIGSEYSANSDGTATWTDLVGNYDVPKMSMNDGNTFTETGYKYVSGKSAFPESILDIVQTGKDSATDSYKSFTIELFIDNFSAPEDSPYQRFIIGSSNDRFAIYRNASKDTLYFKHQSNRVDVAGAKALLEAGCLITITFDYDESVQKGVSTMYCNGIQVDKSASYAKRTDYPFTQDLYIGDALSSAYPYEATFQAIRFYNRAISADEVATNYANDLIVTKEDSETRNELLDESKYVKKGLVSWYNGNQNSLRGHNLEDTVWEDLVSGYDITVAKNDTNYFEEDGGYRINTTRAQFPKEIVDLVNGDTFTVELLVSDFVDFNDPDNNKYNLLLSNQAQTVSLFRHVQKNQIQFKFPNGNDVRPTFSNADKMLKDVLITITYVAGDVCRVYIDGELQNATAAPNHLGVEDLGIGHGAYRSAPSIAYDQIRFYDRALSETEIAQNAAVDGRILYATDGLEALYMQGNYVMSEDGTKATWVDSMGNYDLAMSTVNGNSFTNDGYNRVSGGNPLPVEILDIFQTGSDVSNPEHVYKDFTIEVLIDDFVPGEGSTSSQRFIKGSGNDDRICIYRNSSSDSLVFKHQSNRITVANATSLLNGGCLISITVDYNESTQKATAIMYCNGIEVGRSTYSKHATYALPKSLCIGDTATGVTYGYSANFKAVRFYSKALTSTEVTKNAKVDGMMGRDVLGYIEPAQPKTNIIGDVALTREINSLAELEAMIAASALPSNAIFTVDENLNLLDDLGCTIMSFEEMLEATDYTVLPMVIPANDAAADALVQYSTKSGFSDFAVLTSDKVLLKSTRQAKTNLRGALDLTEEYANVTSLTHNDLVSIRRTVKENLATLVLLPVSAFTHEDIKKLYDMDVSVWAVCSDNPSDAECYKALLSGAMGVISDDTAKMLDIACNEIPENTMVRVPISSGHAGTPALAPANTLEGYWLAYQNGADSLEIDLQLTLDGEVVLIHDLDTTRTCIDPADPTANYVVAETTYEKLRTLKANKGFENDPAFADCYIPTLRELLDLFKDTDVRFLFEPKNSDLSIGRILVEYIEEYDIYDRSTIHSFYPDILAVSIEADSGIAVNQTYSKIVIDEIDSDYDVKGVMNAIGELNAHYNISISSGCGQKAQRAAQIRGIQIHPYTFTTQESYYGHFLMGYAAMIGNDPRGLGKVVKLYSANAPKTLAVGSSHNLSMTVSSYDRTVSTVAPTQIKVISGAELVSLDGGRITANGVGEVTLAIGYSAKVGEQNVTYFDDPITITITEKSSEAVEPSIKILASNLEYADFLHILYAVSVNAPEGATVSDVKMLFWDEAQIAYTKENAKITKPTYTKQSITMGGVTYDNCSLIRSENIAPKEICDDIYAVAYVTIDGVDYYSNVLRYSPLTYVYSRLYTLDNTTPVTEAEITTAQNQRHLYETILKYGAAAQKIFGYTENGLATDDYVFVSVKGGKLDDGFTTDVVALGETVTLIANDTNGFAGWVDEDGNVLSTDATYTYTPDRSIVITASYPEN